MKGFSSDIYFKKEIEKIICDWKIKTIVETGTYQADTTISMAEMVEQVITIEINAQYLKYARHQIKQSGKNNIISIFGSSPKEIEKLNIDEPILFFLDAHWYEYNPLLDELKAIAEKKYNNSVIVIHDFKVPNKNFGYDSYNGFDYDWNYIESAIKSIYGDNFRYYYNEKASGGNRGIIFIFPNK